MRISMKRLVAALSASIVLAAAGVVAIAQPAAAAAEPSFKVTCYPTGIAPNDPIVYPGQAGKAHMHTFYGAKGVDENTTVDTLFAQSSSQCGSHFDTVDLSAYWIPTLYKNGAAVYDDRGGQQLAVYYRRAGGATGDLVAQAFPQGLRIIAGDMHATSPQMDVSYVCAKAGDSGNQRGGTPEFMDCGSDEVLIAKLIFPDCWDGVNLDSADHKSHMAFSSGATASCPSSHPVKLPQITYEAWYHDVDLSGGGLAWSSGSAYSFHGDVISAWKPEAAANLVNQCINVAVDCNPLMYEDIPVGPVSQSQIDAQLVGVQPNEPAPSPPADPGDHPDHGTPPPTTPSAPPCSSTTTAAVDTEAATVAVPVATVGWRDGDPLSFWAVAKATLWTLLKQWGFV